ncbi:hypothetical protein N9C08_01715 [Rubripirellula sp.]|nr:hypothetical protein [Rubripirellula sp.]
MSVLLSESDAIRIEISPPINLLHSNRYIFLLVVVSLLIQNKCLQSMHAPFKKHHYLCKSSFTIHRTCVLGLGGIKDRGLVPTDLTWRLVAVLGLVNRHSRLLAIRQLGKCCSLLGV